MTEIYPLKLRILRAVTDSIKTVTVANGYGHDLGDFVDSSRDDELTPRVYRGRAWFGDGDPLPMISILEGKNPADFVAEPPATTTVSEYDWSIIVQGFVNDDKVNPTDPAYHLMADVRRCLAAEAKRKDLMGMQTPFGFTSNRISRVVVGPGVIRPADDTSAQAYFWFTLTLRIIDNPSTPYA